MSPKKTSELKYEEITKILLDHFAPKKSITSERFKFNKRDQYPNETISDYIVKLRKPASSCEFDQFLEQALRDRLVCGLSNEGIQRKWLAEDALTFTSACKQAISMELAENESRNVMQPSMLNKVFRNQKKVLLEDGSKKSNSKCFRCGRFHNPAQCPALGVFYLWETWSYLDSLQGKKVKWCEYSSV